MRKGKSVAEWRYVEGSRVFKVGDKVRFNNAIMDIEGRVIEDRGDIAMGGKQLYRIRFGEDDDREIELPVDYLSAV